jgi:alkylation response protein AidB-like acyl-CoA dehydrogenase
MVAGFGLGISAVSVGIAWHALDVFCALAETKKQILSELALREKSAVQERVGQVYATLDAADAYLERAATDAFAIAESGRPFTWRERGRLWLAATHAAQTSVQAVESLYTVTGGGAVYAATGLDRCMRDVRTAAQHIMTQILNYEVAGKEVMGLPVFDSIWSFDARDADFPAPPQS